MAGFKAQANLPFVGVYIAQKRGYFREQSLDVTIQHSAGSGEHIRLLSVLKETASSGCMSSGLRGASLLSSPEAAPSAGPGRVLTEPNAARDLVEDVVPSQ